MMKLRKRNGFLAGAAALCATMLGGASPSLAADQVSVQLDWIVRGDHAPFFVARDKGYFSKQGIEVTAIRKGTGSTDALRLVGNGNADFGFGDLPTLLVARTQNIPVTALVAVNQESPLAIISVKAKHPLTKPADLKGLNIGIHPSGSTYIFFKAFLAANGMSLTDVKQSTVAPPYENYLVLGRVDAVPGYLDAEVPEIAAKTGGPNSLSILQGSDFGWKAFGSGVFTSQKMITEKADVVQRFVNAYQQGFQFTVEHPKDAIDLTVAANPEFKGKEEVLSEELQADIDHTIFSPSTKAHGIGWMDPEQWKATIETLQSQGGLPADAKLAGSFDNKFVEASSPLKR